MRTILLFLGMISLVRAADSLPALPASSAPTPAVGVSKPPAGRTLWRISLAALAASNALDIQSSWGKHELNPNLAGPSGLFGVQGALVKVGIQGGLVGIEYLITRHRPSPRLYRALSVINFGASAGIAGVAAHNYTVAAPGR